MGPSGHFYSYVDPVWSVYNVGTGFILGRAPRIKETLLDFRYVLSPEKGDSMEWCQVTRHRRIFCGLTGCQWTPGKWGVTPEVHRV